MGESRPGSGGPRDPSSPAGRSRPTSVVSASQLSSAAGDVIETASSPATVQTTTTIPQPLSIAPLTTVYEAPSTPKPEIITYSKGVQTTEPWSPPKRRQSDSDGEQQETHGPDWSPSKAKRSSKRWSRIDRIRDDELRQNIRKEIEDELKALQDGQNNGAAATTEPKFLARQLTDEELNAVTSSDDFFDFVERSSKVIERALEEEYDLLTDYAMAGLEDVDEDEDGFGTSKGKKGRRIREITQFYDERWSKKRMISDLNFSQKVCILYATARRQG